MKIEQVVLNEERNVTLTAYLQQTEGEFNFSKRPAMVILPGGAYWFCSDREADPVAAQYLKAGYQCFVLRYTITKYGGWPNPINDFDQAMELIAEKQDEWGVDTKRIAVVGFSAGGHLAAVAATMAQHRPSAAVLVYPAILRGICDMCQPGMPCPNEHVTEDTCPCFIAGSRNDDCVDVTNIIAMESALAEKGIPFECHIYSKGDHGFSTAEDWLISPGSACPRVKNWVDDSIEWLGETMGEFVMEIKE